MNEQRKMFPYGTSKTFLYRNQIPFHVERIRDRHFQCLGNLKGEEHRWVGVAVLDTHDRLPAYSGTHRKFFLSHALFKPQDADAILDGHWVEGEELYPAHSTDASGGCKCFFMRETFRHENCALQHKMT